MSTIRRVFLDLDGVIVNCNKSAARAYGVGYPATEVLGYDWVTRTYNEQHPEAPITGEDFGRIVAKDPTFWFTTEWFPWADDLVAFLEQRFPGQWNFLTKCTSYPECAAGKYTVVSKRYGREIAKKLVLTFAPKHVLCRPGNILIDDWEQNCAEWEAAGGIAYRWRELGDQHPDGRLQLQQCLQFLQDYQHA